ncbi:MAG: hypothetical protein WCK89_06660, partial [bacterium]
MAFFACLTGVLLWQMRVDVVTRVARWALDQQGLTDATFRLSQVSFGQVVVEDIRLGTPEAVLIVDQVDVRFSCREVLRRHIARVAVRGVRTRLTAGGGKAMSPLYERLKPLLAARAKTAPAGATANTGFSLGAGVLQEVQVAVALAGGEPLTTLTLDAGVLAERPAQYRVWGTLSDGGGMQLRSEGVVDSDTGAGSLLPELKIKSVGKLLDWAGRVFPDQAARIPAFPTNCTLAVRGAVAVQGWTNVGPFEINAELGRGSAWVFPDQDAFVRFQSFRVEV